MMSAQTFSTTNSDQTLSAQVAPQSPVARPARWAIWTGRILSALAVLFLLFDVTIKLLVHPMAVAGTVDLGYPADSVFLVGVLGAVCLLLYVIPQTTILGAVLWTGYLGGAIATHVRVGNPLFSHVLFPVYVALFIWGGVWLRDQQLRALFPVRRR